ncbi:hypothetical protein CHCC20375_0160 [Bacillus licheniformis]|nr:hypothetical protein CHCC20375_0160 [Bacillus licheniformis]
MIDIKGNFKIEKQFKIFYLIYKDYIKKLVFYTVLLDFITVNFLKFYPGRLDFLPHTCTDSILRFFT